MNNNRKISRFLLSMIIIFAMFLGDYGRIFAGDVEGDESATDYSVMNTAQNSDIRLVKGQTYDLAVYSYEYDSSQGLFSIDAKGKLTSGKTEGTGSFTIKNSVTSQTVTVEISGKSKAKVDKDAKKITIGKEKKIFLPGQITYTVSSATDAGGNSLNSKDLKKVATVKKGKISAKGAGNATILLGGLVDSECSVTIYDPVLAEKKLDMGVGETGRTLSINAAGSIPVEWASSDPNVVRIVRRSLKSVEVDAYSAGKAVISATVNGKTFECKVKVSTPKNRMSAVALDLSTSGKGKSKKLIGNGLKKLEFKSLDPEIAAVDAKGKITAVKAGTTHILVSTKGSDKAFSSTVVSVYDIEPDAKISVPPGGFAPIAISVNGIRESNGYSVPVFFKSAKTSIATVNANGFVHGIKPGKTRINVTACGTKYTIDVLVSADAQSPHIHDYKDYSSDGVKYCEQCGSWYIPAAYKISFNSNGGNEIESITIPEGETVSSYCRSLPVPRKQGFDFLGWYIDPEFKYLFEIRQPLTSNLTLYAGWEQTLSDTEGEIVDPGFVTGEYRFESLDADIKDILADGNDHEVTFFAQMYSDAYIDTSADEVAVYENDTKVAVLKDNGLNPDKDANDGIFSGWAYLSSTEVIQKEYIARYKDAESDPLSMFYYHEIPEEEIIDNNELLNEISSLNTAEEVLEKLKNSDVVDQASIAVSDDNKQIVYKTISGIPVMLEEPMEGNYKGTPTYDKNGNVVTSSSGLSYDDVREKIRSRSITPVRPDNNVCVVRPFHGDDLKYDDFKNTGEIVAEALGGKCDVIDDELADVEAFKKFGDYDIILIDSHGICNYAVNSFDALLPEEPYILTGETMEASKAWLTPDFYLQNIIIHSSFASFGKFEGGNIGVGPGFFEKYYSVHTLDDSMFFLGCCLSTYKYTLPVSLLNKGADAVWGFNHIVSHNYNNDTQFELILNELLLKGNSASTAQANTLKTCGEKDPEGIKGHEAELQLYWYPFNDYHLARSEGGSFVSGCVYSYDGGTVANATVSFTMNNSDYQKKTQVNPDGTFTVILTPGNYSMSVSAYGYITEFRDLIVVEEGQGTNLDQTILLRPLNKETNLTGKITSSMDGSGVPYAQIRFRKDHDNKVGEYIKYTDGQDVVIHSNQYGNYSFTGLPEGYYTMEVSRPGYYNSYKNIIATNSTSLQNLSLTPVIYYGTEDLRIVLEWGRYPTDLDSHLTGPRPDGGYFHTWFHDKEAYCQNDLIAYLDLDDRSSYGPETTRVNNIIDGEYSFYVVNYSYDEPLNVSGASVHVYGREGELCSFNIPYYMKDGTERYWNVFTCTRDPESGDIKINPVNTLTNTHEDPVDPHNRSYDEQ